MTKTIEVSHANLVPLLKLMETDPRVTTLCTCDENGAVSNWLHSVEVTLDGEKVVCQHGDFISVDDNGVVAYVVR